MSEPTTEVTEMYLGYLEAFQTLDPRAALPYYHVPSVLPARLARPQRRPVLHLPAHWPRADAWLTFWTAVFTT